jgi:S1-C subfamily serine protease
MRTGTFLSLVLAVASGLVLGTLARPWAERLALDLGPPPVPVTVAPRGELAADEAATIALFEATRGAVVSISTAARGRDMFSRRVEVPRGTGSGFVWDGAGHIVTNAHVVAGATRANVLLPDGRSFEAELIGSNARHDLAVLRIPARGLAPLAVGTSADLQVGQKVFAIGNPFGLDFTLTTGVVSALERELPGERGVAIQGLVQTDAAINPGNSGGPLLDSAGRLIGVNTAIYSPSGASAGIGFAVPVDAVARVVPQLIARGRYSAPVLGIVADPRADAVLARSGRAGVLILDVEAGGPAARAGLEPAEMTRGGVVPGDVIVAVEGRDLRDVNDLRAVLDERAPGDVVTVLVERGGDRREVEVELAAGEG